MRARQGVDLYKDGEYAAAADKFEEARRLDPTFPVLSLNAGTSRIAHLRAVGAKTEEGQGAAAKAIAAFEQYLELRPDDKRVRAALVETFVEAGRYDDAALFFQRAASANDVEALGTLATIAAKCGKGAEAESWHAKRIAASPTKAEGYLAYGGFLYQELREHGDWPHERRREKAEIAIETLKKSIELQPAAPNGYTYVNLVHRELAKTDPTEDNRQRHLEEARKYLQMALDRQNANTGANANANANAKRGG
jgi:tetratricopeptide (TPR) repeat protein